MCHQKVCGSQQVKQILTGMGNEEPSITIKQVSGNILGSFLIQILFDIFILKYYFSAGDKCHSNKGSAEKIMRGLSAECGWG